MKSHYNVYTEFMRILLTVYIILMHSEYLYRDISANRIFEGGYLGVEFFFILSGYFIAAKASGETSISTYMKSRLKALYPHYILSILGAVLLTRPDGFFGILEQLRDIFWSVLMLQHMGLNVTLYNGFVWYVTFLFYAGTLVYALLKKYDGPLFTKLSCFYIAAFYLVYFALFHMIDCHYPEFIVILPLAFYRSMADILLGTMVFKWCSNHQLPWSAGVKRGIVFAATLLALSFSFFRPHSWFDLAVIACWCVCIGTAQSMVSTRELSGVEKAIVFCGRKIYSLYCYQQIVYILAGNHDGYVPAPVILLLCVLTAALFEILYEKILRKGVSRVFRLLQPIH